MANSLFVFEIETAYSSPVLRRCNRCLFHGDFDLKRVDFVELRAEKFYCKTCIRKLSDTMKIRNMGNRKFNAYVEEEPDLYEIPKTPKAEKRVRVLDIIGVHGEISTTNIMAAYKKLHKEEIQRHQLRKELKILFDKGLVTRRIVGIGNTGHVYSQIDLKKCA
jgi:DNA-binding transcriptional ArsR family regulator